MGTTGLQLLPSRAFSRAEKLRVRTLYLQRGFAPSEIAEAMSKEVRQITNLITRQKWAAKRKAVEEKAEQEAVDVGLDNARTFVESVAQRAEELVEKGFDMADGATDAKEFAFAASGTKTFVGLVRQARGLDSQNVLGGPTLNVIFGAPTQQPTEKIAERVTPEALQNEGEPTDLDFA